MKIVLIGAGIMSATLSVMLRKLMPNAEIVIFERLDRVARESSAPWNNAGTGHSAFCELNYTPFENGQIDIGKALSIAEDFEISKQFWTYLIESEKLPTSESFINPMPHMSLVWGEENVDFLQKRYQEMVKHALFQDMEISLDPNQIGQWIPLMMDGRNDDSNIASTRMCAGTDVNFGKLTSGMLDYVTRTDDTNLFLCHNVNDLSQDVGTGKWELQVENLENNEVDAIEADHIFIGAGGASITLLEKSGLKEAEGFGGFPISGQFLQCDNPSVVSQHQAKVYGKAAVGSPPMSVPHLDTRLINGKRTLFFGPYAGFTTKFLKNGSYLDLPLSIDTQNVWPMISAGLKNVDLTKYLAQQVTQSQEDRFKELLAYYPKANIDDWSLTTAGQRVQVIKKDANGDGELRFGTEVVCAEDGSIAALLGASPGASTSVSIMLNVLDQMFPEQFGSDAWQTKIKEMIPTFGRSLIDNPDLCIKTREQTNKILNLG